MPTSPKLIARALTNSPLQRPLVGCAFLGMLLLLFGLAFLGHLTLWIINPLPAIGVFLGTTLLATLTSIPVLLLFWALDRRERESFWLFSGAVVWGAVISTGISALLNALGFGFIVLGLEVAADLEDAVVSELLTAALVAPPVEEAAKGLGVLLLFWFLRAEFDNLRDGIIYGALIGLGFNIAETALYVMQGFVETGTPPLGQQFAARFVFLGLNTHLLWSALCGAGVGLARQTARRWVALLAPVAGYALAVLGHALNNSVGIFALALFLILMGFDLTAGLDVPLAAFWGAAALMNILVQGFPYLVLLILLGLSAQWERSVLRTYLADEVATGAVLPGEYAAIARGIPIFGMRADARAGGRIARQIANAQSELAFRKWHLAREGGDLVSDPLVAAWRQDIATLRGG